MLSASGRKQRKNILILGMLMSLGLPTTQSGADSARLPAFARVPEILQSQIQNDVMSAIERNYAAKTYGEYNNSGYSAKDVFSNVRALRDSNGWTALCLVLDALPPENLALFENEIILPPNLSQLSCAPTLRGKLSQYWQENGTRFRQHLAQISRKPRARRPASVHLVEERKISISESPTVNRAEVKESEIALTFNDGPDANRTPRVLDILRSAKIRATFFHIGEHIRAKPEIDHRLVDDGHTLGTHTFSHIDLVRADLKKADKQILKGREEAEAASGVDAPFFRPPYGLLSNEVRDILKRRKMPVFQGNIDSLDWKIRDESALYDNLLKAIEREKGGVLILHETEEATVGVLRALIEELKSRGFTFVVFVPGN